jgi:hypothetical protein
MVASWAPSKKDNIQRRHLGHPKQIIFGPFGPHPAKMICLKCDGAWIKWMSKNTSKKA